MSAAPANEVALISEVYRALATILNERVIKNSDMQRPKVAVAVMSITSAWLISALAQAGDDISICEEALKRSLRVHLAKHGIEE